MEGLRADQEALLARHRERSREALDGLLAGVEVSRGLPDPDDPEFRDLLRSPSDVLVSCAISLLEHEHDRFQEAIAAAAESDDPDGDAQRALAAALEDALAGTESSPDPAHALRMALRKLHARRLSFSAADVEVMLDLAIEQAAFWHFPFVAAAAERLLAAEPGNPSVLAALERASSRLNEVTRAFYDANLRSARNRIRALIAANVPGGLLDLSIVDDGDAWAEPARAILVAHAGRWQGVQELLAHFASARGSKPTKSWSRRTAELLEEHADAFHLSRELLDLVLAIDVVAMPQAVGWTRHWLLAPGNETLLKGAAWSLRLKPAEWVVPLLGRLVLRAAARSPDDGVTEPLSAALASSALDSLIALERDDARDELRSLLTELRRRDLLKRIAAALGEQPEETAARDEAIRREKQRAVRAKANPQPAREQRDASGRVRTELAPRLWELGFTARKGRTFWRHHSDRVEVLHVASQRGELSVEIGVWFKAPRRSHPPPEQDGEPSPPSFHCDLRARLDGYDLVQSALRAESWFLRFEDPAGVLSFLLSDADEGVFLGGAPGSPARDLLIGYLAPRAGRPELAAEHLTRAAAFFREQLEERRRQAPRDITPEWEAWVDGLESDAAAA